MSDGVRLPRLTREELVALGDPPALVDAEDHAWWQRLDPTQREQVVDSAWRGLLARDLARSTRQGMRADARLRFIVTARSLARLGLRSRRRTPSCAPTASTCPKGPGLVRRTG